MKGVYKLFRSEKKGMSKKNGYVIETGHKAMWVYKTVVDVIQGQLLCYYNCTESNKLCCQFLTKEQFEREGWKKDE